MKGLIPGVPFLWLMCWEANCKKFPAWGGKKKSGKWGKMIGFCWQPEEANSWSVEFIVKWSPNPVAFEINRKLLTGFSISLF